MEITRVQDETTFCRQRIVSSPNEIQGMRATMGHGKHLRSELAAGFATETDKVNLDERRAVEHLNRKRDVSFAEHDLRHGDLERAVKELKESVLSCRSRAVATKARVSQLRELVSVRNSARSPEVGTTPSKCRSRDEASRTELDAPLEPALLNFAYRTSDKIYRFKPTSGLCGRMEEFRRLKVISPNAFSREFAEFQAFAKAVTGYRENTGDGYGSEGRRGGDNREDSGDDKQPRRQSSRKDSKDSHERSPRDRPSLGPKWEEKSYSCRNCSSSNYSRRENRRPSHRCRRRKKIKIIQQNLNLYPDQPRRYNILHLSSKTTASHASYST